MNVRRNLRVLTLCLAVALCAHASASAGWGPRVGLSSDPDQIFGGFQWNVGEIAPHLRAMPSAELGLGDDILRLAGNIGIHYMFTGGTSRWAPYLGGELTLSYLDFDRPAGFTGDDTDTELGLSLAAGVETRLTGGKILNLELRFGLENTPDVQVHAGWIF